MSKASYSEIHRTQDKDSKQQKLQPDDPFDTGKVDQGQHHNDKSSNAPLYQGIGNFVFWQQSSDGFTKSGSTQRISDGLKPNSNWS